MRKNPRSVGDYGVVINEKAEKLWHGKCSREAQYAYEYGQEALKKGALYQACFWLGRADRLAPKDVKVGFSYCMALLKAGRFKRFLDRLEGLKKNLYVRELIFAECLALWGNGKKAEAESILKEALSRYVSPVEFHSLIEVFVTQGQYPGWGELSNSGLLTIHASQPVSLVIDGRQLGLFETREVWLGSVFREGVCLDWAQGRRLSVKAGGQHLLGSPFDIKALTHCESLVWPQASALEGWLWYPAEPEFVPHIQVDGKDWITAERSADIGLFNPLGQVKAFSLPLSDLSDQGRETVRLTNDHGAILTGTPLDPKLGRVLGRKMPYPAQYRPVPVQPRPSRNVRRRLERPRCVVILPVYAGYQATMECLTSVLETAPTSVEIIVIDDASPEKNIARALDKLAADNKITLLRNTENQGFPASVNRGLRYAEGADVILLNSDTVVFEGWVQRLQEWLNITDVGTVTPFSNHATLLSYPSVEKENPFPDKREARLIDQYCQENGTSTEIELPTGNGFCMAISAECLAETGWFRDDIFVQGYGEENDFCLRATARGFRHLAAVNVYVRHKGGNSFGKSRLALIERNLKILNALHPGYDLLVAEFMRRDPLFMIRRRLDLMCLMQKARKKGAVLLIEHNYGGGVARTVQQRAEAYEREGLLALRLRPSFQGCVLESCNDPDLWPNLCFALPEDSMLLIRCLRKVGVQSVEWHHLVGHAPWIRRLHKFLDVPLDIFVHDHVWFCPRIILLNPEGRYCGERSVQACKECIRRDRKDLKEKITIDELLERSIEEFKSARSITAPSYDAARRLERHFPQIEGLVKVHAPENEAAFPPLRISPASGKNFYRVGVVGGISRWKGYEILLELGQYIRQHGLPLEIVLIGGTRDDQALINAGIQVTGTYDDKEVLSLIEEMELDVGFLPSIAPETWSYALSWLWKAGLAVICFDIGAVSERIRRRGDEAGKILPLGLPVERLASYILHYLSSRKK
ncbi:glycosyltransferase [Acetobacteraceae bacterium ESL0709]|nr:glycosyltransferase [Acetobacteraceae bacterium ESL0697]MDF7677225.1 glycosyltransferase [Acetobacteraceae bacterium ESL0709]